jgi:hypothetical protein
VNDLAWHEDQAAYWSDKSHVLQADNMIRINPPLVASDAEIELVVETLISAVRTASRACEPI